MQTSAISTTGPLVTHSSSEIPFFSRRLDCIRDYQGKPWIKRALYVILSYGRLIAHFLYKKTLILRGAEKKMLPYTIAPQEGFSHSKLVICIHGLSSRLSQFEEIVNEVIISKKEDPLDIFVPKVFEKGNCKLDDAAQPIFEEIKKWSAKKTGAEKELTLVGISNGARIAREIETRLGTDSAGSQIKRFRFVSVVGACQGSSLANLAHRVKMPWLLSKNVSTEMPTKSERSLRLDREWNASLINHPEMSREYTFFASPHDWLVPNYSSTLMKVPSSCNARYSLIPGHGHKSIVSAISKTIAKVILS